MILLDDKNKSSETHLFSQSLFSGEDYSLASSTDLLFLIFCSLPYCEAVQLIDTSDKTNSQITSNCFTVCRGTVDSLLQTSSAIYIIVIISDFHETSSSVTFTLCVNRFLLINTFSFLFLQTSTYQLDVSVF